MKVANRLVLAALAGIIAAENSASLAVTCLRRSTTDVVLLGTKGGPWPGIARSEPAMLLQVGDRPYLVDAGAGTFRRLVEAGVRPDKITSVFISHHHPDHNLDLANFIANAMLAHGWLGNEGPWSIYGPAGTKTMVSAAINYVSVPIGVFIASGLGNQVEVGTSPDRRPPWKRFRDSRPETYIRAMEFAEDGVIFQDDRLRVVALQNTHFTAFDHAKRNPFLGSFSFRFETADRTIIYTGDTGVSDRLVEFARGADLLVSEVIDPQRTREQMNSMAKSFGWTQAALQRVLNHMDIEHLPPQAVGELARSAGIKSVLLTHFVPGLDDGTDADASVEGVRRVFAGEVIAGKDLGCY